MNDAESQHTSVLLSARQLLPITYLALTIPCVLAILSLVTVTIVLSTGSLYNYSVERVFALGRDVGFDGIEVLVDRRWDTRQADYLRSLSEAFRLPVLSLHTPFELHIHGWEENPVLRVQRTVALARALGARVVVAHLPHRWHWLSITSTWLDSRRLRMPILWPAGQGYASWLSQGLDVMPVQDGVQVAVENMPARWLLGHRVNPWRFNNVQDLIRFKALVLDTTHLGTWGMDILAVYERLKARIVHLHLSDYDGREHRLPGQGHLPLAELLRRMSSDGFRGLIAVETCPEALGAGDDGRVRLGLSDALRFCRQQFPGGRAS